MAIDEEKLAKALEQADKRGPSVRGKPQFPGFSLEADLGMSRILGRREREGPQDLSDFPFPPNPRGE